MKSVTLAFVLAACLGGFLALLVVASDTALLAAPLAVAIGVLAASIAFGDVTWLTVTLGALSPLAFTMVSRFWRIDAGLAVSVLLWIAPRFTLAPTGNDAKRALVASCVASGIAGFVVAAYALDAALLRLSACVFAGAAISLATVFSRVDTPVAAALSAAARVLEGEVAKDLERAAASHRRLSRLPSGEGETRPAFRDLLNLADRRAMLRELSGPEATRMAADLDGRIKSLVALLGSPDDESTAASAAPASGS